MGSNGNKKKTKVPDIDAVSMAYVRWTEFMPPALFKRLSSKPKHYQFLFFLLALGYPKVPSAQVSGFYRGESEGGCSYNVGKLLKAKVNSSLLADLKAYEDGKTVEERKLEELYATATDPKRPNLAVALNIIKELKLLKAARVLDTPEPEEEEDFSV